MDSPPPACAREGGVPSTYSARTAPLTTLTLSEPRHYNKTQYAGPKHPYADCFSWDINAIQLDNSHLNNQKDLIGPEIEFSTEISVHYHLKKLKHGLKYPLPLFVIFESKQRIHNFQIEYVINVGNHPKQINGKLFVMLKKNEIEIV